MVCPSKAEAPLVEKDTHLAEHRPNNFEGYLLSAELREPQLDSPRLITSFYIRPSRLGDSEPTPRQLTIAHYSGLRVKS